MKRLLFQQLLRLASDELVRELQKQGASVQVIMTQAAEKFVSPWAREQALRAQQAARQALAAGKAEQGAADFALAEAKAALNRSEPTGGGQAAQGLWSLKSPIMGRVLKLHLESAAPVNPGQALMEIGDVSALEAVIDVLSSEVVTIQPGAAVQLSLGGSAAPLAGRVERIDPVAFTKVSALGIEEQRVNVIVGVEGGAEALQGLGDGYRVEARIITQAQDDALLAPSAALVRDGTAWRVFVVEGGRANARTVTLKDRNADQAWIDGGLKAGESVVLYPGSMVADGQAVKVGR